MLKNPHSFNSLRFLALLITAVSILVTIAPTAQAARELVRPNAYTLRGEGIEITYSTTSIAGAPILTYRTRHETLTFKGEEIRVLDTEIGQLITLTIEQAPDLKTVTLSLLIPQINLQNSRSVRFWTQGVFTTHLTSIGGPSLVKGVLQTYDLVRLSGTARSLVF